MRRGRIQEEDRGSVRGGAKEVEVEVEVEEEVGVEVEEEVGVEVEEEGEVEVERGSVSRRCSANESLNTTNEEEEMEVEVEKEVEKEGVSRWKREGWRER